MTGRPNVLLITLDQFRGDCLSAAGHPVVRTPHLDALAAEGVRFARHYSQCAPCGPGRASLYTGMYQFNHRVVANGTPLDRRFDNVALAAQRAGYEPVLFGYTDQSIDPREATGPDDPRLSTYEGVLPGFDVELDLTRDHVPWLEWLSGLGYDTAAGVGRLLATEHARPDEHSLGAFMTDRVLAWLDGQGADRPWFAHLSYLRPHPPYSAPGEWSGAYDPGAAGTPIAPPPDDRRSAFHDLVLGVPEAVAPADPAKLARIRAQYFGMVSHADHQLGRLFDALRAAGAWSETLVVVTADHAELLGDHGLLGKLGYWEQSYAIPCIVRDPAQPDGHGAVVTQFTENVDLMPTICAAIGVPVPAQCDGVALTPFLAGVLPADWRAAAHWEFDWRAELVQAGLAQPDALPWSRTLARHNLATLRNDTHAYVQFGEGHWLCFELAADPTWRTTTRDPGVVLPLAQAMLQWRTEHADRTLTGMLCEDGGVGRWPDVPWPQTA